MEPIVSPLVSEWTTPKSFTSIFLFDFSLEFVVPDPVLKSCVCFGSDLKPLISLIFKFKL